MITAQDQSSLLLLRLIVQLYQSDIFVQIASHNDSCIVANFFGSRNFDKINGEPKLIVELTHL